MSLKLTVGITPHFILSYTKFSPHRLSSCSFDFCLRLSSRTWSASKVSLYRESHTSCKMAVRDDNVAGGGGVGSGSARRVVAILHQAAPPPAVNGIRKPMKPGGYQDAGADIAYTLTQASPSHNITVLTPTSSPPSPSVSEGWTYPDTEAGILSAIHAGATHLWANTILFSSHPLQIAPSLAPYLETLRVIGQPPSLVEVADDKEFVNDVLRSKKGMFTLPAAWGVTSVAEVEKLNAEKAWTYPVVAKPIRGRGSSGVKVCRDGEDLKKHVAGLLGESSRAMIEQYLSGEEATITVMPPSRSSPQDDYVALPPVVRYNHFDGVAPWNGIVAVSANSRVVTPEEMEQDGAWEEIMRECVEVAKVLGAMAVVRIDVRRFGVGEESGREQVGEAKGKGKGRFALFDVNLKPNMTGAGRPGRDDQTSLCGIAASGLGWDFEKLLLEMLDSARTLREVRDMKPTLAIGS